jgi:hypothetical protein
LMARVIPLCTWVTASCADTILGIVNGMDRLSFDEFQATPKS